jgi:hypothetical protein
VAKLQVWPVQGARQQCVQLASLAKDAPLAANVAIDDSDIVVIAVGK